MGCFGFCGSKTPATMQTSVSETAQQDPESKNVRQEVLLRIPGCKAHLMDEGVATELANGEFTLIRVSEENVSLATIIKVGEDLQWPLTQDEPVVKVDALQYLFSLPIDDGDLLSYGVTFSEQSGGSLGLLDSFLKDLSCFSCPTSTTRNKNVDWKEFAPRVEDYNNVLAKSIAGGTGQIVRGIFTCSNAYVNQVQNEGEMIITSAKTFAPAARQQTATAEKTLDKSSFTFRTKVVGKSFLGYPVPWSGRARATTKGTACPLTKCSARQSSETR